MTPTDGQSLRPAVADEAVDGQAETSSAGEDERAEDELAEDELAEDELAEDELAEDELAEDELAEDGWDDEEWDGEEWGEDDSEERDEDEPASLEWWRGRSRRWWTVRLALLAALLLVDAAIVVLVLVATYQPLTFGGKSVGNFPGLPSAKGLRRVNDFGGLQGQLYLPPQVGTFSIATSIVNNGAQTVTLDGVSLDPPGDRSRWPLTAVGQARYQVLGGLPNWPTYPIEHSIKLYPHEALWIALPVRLADTCYSLRYWTGVDQVWFEVDWLGFHHWVAIQLEPILMHDPEPPNQPKLPGLPPTACLVAPRHAAT